MTIKSKFIFANLICASTLSLASAAQAKDFTIKPILDLRLRLETVDQPTTDADAVTARMRTGIELVHKDGLSFLVEGEATLGIVNDYNSTTNGKVTRSVIADPQNTELNRLQIQYASKGKGKIVIGRQRINIDDQRFVGSVGWRQNEQTFDAVSVSLEAFKPLTFDATYAISQRTIFGVDAGPREHYDGDFVFLGAAAKVGPVNVKAFSYLIDYDPAQPVSLTSTQTYGARATTKLKLSKAFVVDLAASYAKQSDYQANPGNFSVDYIAAEASTTLAGFGLTAGYEKLGANGAGARFQTPFATLHKFNGFADLFLSTPVNGLQDYYITLGRKFPKVKALPGLNAAVTYHKFDSDKLNLKYGDEIDATLGFKISKFSIGMKYANYNSKGFGVDTKKFWFDFGYAF
jgi:Alginate export